MADENRPKDYVFRHDTSVPLSAIARWDANLKAIRISKELDAEGRQPTKQEQAALAEYSGFGDAQFSAAFPAPGQYRSRDRDTAWDRRKEDLEEMVTPAELEGIRGSRLNAMFTTPEVVKTMWKGLSDMGADKLDSPNVLEPSAGSGRFLGLQPEAMAAKSKRTAVELDPMTASILKHTYPATKVYNTGFENAPLPDEHFDVAISNVPFGNYPVNDKEFNARGKEYLTHSIHNYFFAKTLDKLRPGGVMAFITTHNTMDSQRAQPVRQYLADRADLLGAVRLPEDAFPDTQVVTDIMYLRKRAEGDPPGDDKWVKTEKVKVGNQYQGGPAHEFSVNKYYVDHPEKVMGRHSAEGSMYRGNSYTVKADKGEGPLGDQITKETDEIAAKSGGIKSTGQDAGSVEDVYDAERNAKLARVKGGKPEYVVEDGELYEQRGSEIEKSAMPKARADKVKSLVAIRTAARQLITQESGDTGSETVEESRRDLRNLYDSHVGEHGEAINTPENRKLLGANADNNLLFALENYDKATECWQPSGIMERRAVGAVPVQKANSPEDALVATLNESGRLDFARMGEMIGKDETEVREELEEAGLVYRSPDGQSWQTSEEYLSGNVREKLRKAQTAAQADPAFRAHVAALEQVQPNPIAAEDIGTPLGAPWIPASVINQWAQEKLRPEKPSYRQMQAGLTGQFFKYGTESEAFVGQSVNEETGKTTNKREGTASGGWQMAEKMKLNPAVESQQWGTPQMKAQAILLKVLQGSPISVTMPSDDGKKRIPDPGATLEAQQKGKEMQADFEKWVWENEERSADLEERYNDVHNAHAPRVFDGSNQTFPGMSEQWQKQMRPHQRDAIHRVVKEGTALLAHEVGFGKSATMAASAMERKRLGLADKPVFVVPKATLGQFADQFTDVYPGAKLLTPDEDDFKQENRGRFLASIATGNWDGIILSSEQFEKIPLSPATEEKWIADQKTQLIAALMEVDGTPDHVERTQKEFEKKIKKYDVRLEQLREKMAARSDDTIDFEDLGVDQIYVDEADRYKNLPYVSQMASGRSGIKGLPQSESQRAWDMYMKARWLQEKHGERPDGKFAKGGVVFATGTPVANTLAETWTMMRYLQPAELKRRKLEHFDAWAKTFGIVEAGIEQTAAGQYKNVQRFGKFDNLPELAALFQNVADVRVASEVPEMLAAQPRLLGSDGQSKRITVVAPETPELKSYMDDIVKRVGEIGRVPPEEDNMLKISSDARKASLDLRMVRPDAPYNPQGKIPMAAEQIAKIYEEEAEDKGTQLVFLDLGTPKAKEAVNDDMVAGDDEELTGEEQSVLKNVYGTLRKDLAAKGVPEDQVAFIHDYKSDDDRQALFDEVKAGTVRVLVGSTDKIGVGVNVQDRAAAAHHIDVPWRPRDVEQREGRIIRQGNKVYGPKLDPETKEVIGPGKGVKIFQYVQEKSFDGFMWQAVEKKARPIKSLMKRKQEQRQIEDIDPFVMGAAEAKALATGDPLVFRFEELRQKMTAARIGREAHRRSQSDAKTRKREMESRLDTYKRNLPGQESDAEYIKNLPEGEDFAMTVGRKTFAKRQEAGESLLHTLKTVQFDPREKEESLGTYKGFEVSGLNGGRGYQMVMRHPETKQPYHTAYIEDGALSAPGLVNRLDTIIRELPTRAEKTRASLTQGEESIAIYDDLLDKPYHGDKELDFYERQARVVQAKLAESEENLQPGDDSSMDVMSDDWQSYTAPERESPDVDSVNLRGAVEATQGLDAADTPGELSEVLDSARQGSAARQTDLANAISKLKQPTNARGMLLKKELENALEEVGAQADPKATPVQVQRIKALAELAPGRLSNRLAERASEMEQDEAVDAIEDLTELIENTNDPKKIGELGRLQSEWGEWHGQSAPPVVEQEERSQLEERLARVTESPAFQAASTRSEPEPTDAELIEQARQQDMGQSETTEEPEPPAEVEDDALSPANVASTADLLRRSGRSDVAEEFLGKVKAKFPERYDTAETPAEGEPSAEPEPEPADDAPTATEMFEQAKSGPVALTGPGSIMERIGEEEKAQKDAQDAGVLRTAAKMADTIGPAPADAAHLVELAQRNAAYEVAQAQADERSARIAAEADATPEPDPNVMAIQRWTGWLEEHKADIAKGGDDRSRAIAEMKSRLDSWERNHSDFPGIDPFLSEWRTVLEDAKRYETMDYQKGVDGVVDGVNARADERSAARKKAAEGPKVTRQEAYLEEIQKQGGEISFGSPEATKAFHRAAVTERDDIRSGDYAASTSTTQGELLNLVDRGILTGGTHGEPFKLAGKGQEAPEPAQTSDSVPSTEPTSAIGMPEPSEAVAKPAPANGPDGMEGNVAKIKQSFGKSESIPISGEDTMDAPVKPKRGRPPKAKPAKSERAPDPENTPIVLPKQLALGDDTLYQGHWGPGIGNLKRDNEEKRDGDKDTVVSERRPKKSDSFKQSPVPISGELTGRFARLNDRLQKEGKSVKDGKALRRKLNRKPSLKLNTPWRAPTIRVIRQ